MTKRNSTHAPPCHRLNHSTPQQPVLMSLEETTYTGTHHAKHHQHLKH